MHEPASKKESALSRHGVIKPIGEDCFLTRLDAAELSVDVRAQAWVSGEVRKVLDDEDDNKIRLTGNICHEDQGVGDVSVAEMNNGTPHPGSELALTRRQDAVHRFAHSRTLLYAIQALTGVGQRVSILLAE